MAINAKSIKFNDTVSYTELLDIVWPVGSTYLTTSDISPSQTLGGTWIEKKDGMVAACGSGVIYPGRGHGEIQGSYTITVNQMPSHGHKIWNNRYQTVSPPIGEAMEYFDYSSSGVSASLIPYTTFTSSSPKMHYYGNLVDSNGGGQVISLTRILSIAGCELPKGGEA